MAPPPPRRRTPLLLSSLYFFFSLKQISSLISFFAFIPQWVLIYLNDVGVGIALFWSDPWRRWWWWCRGRWWSDPWRRRWWWCCGGCLRQEGGRWVLAPSDLKVVVVGVSGGWLGLMDRSERVMLVPRFEKMVVWVKMEFNWGQAMVLWLWQSWSVNHPIFFLVVLEFRLWHDSIPACSSVSGRFGGSNRAARKVACSSQEFSSVLLPGLMCPVLHIWSVVPFSPLWKAGFLVIMLSNSLRIRSRIVLICGQIGSIKVHLCCLLFSFVVIVARSFFVVCSVETLV